MKIKEIERLINEYNDLGHRIHEGENFTTTVDESLCNRHSTNTQRMKITPRLKNELDTVIENYIESLIKRREWIKEELEDR